ACKRLVLDQCKISGETFCSCTDPALPACGPTTSTSSTTTTTTTTLGEIQCCLRTVQPCGPFDNCQVMSAGACAGAGGFNVGPGTCAGPAPCAQATTTTPPSACCRPSTPGGPSDQCTIEGFCECSQGGGTFRLFQSCTPNPCVTTTTTPTTTTTSTIPVCTFLLKWGVPSGTGNGELISSTGVATDASGNVYVADTGNHRIQKFDASGTFLTTWGSSGSGNGQFSFP